MHDAVVAGREQAAMSAVKKFEDKKKEEVKILRKELEEVGM